MAHTQPIRLTKVLFPSEPRHSKQLNDPKTMQMVYAVENATRVSSFYHAYMRYARSKNEPINILPRDAVQILSQMKNQQLYICDAGAVPDARIFAASMLWEQEIPIASSRSGPGDEIYDIANVLEIGTQLSILPGFNLQWMMTAVLILERMVYDPVGVVFAATYGDSVKSARNMTTNMHFVEWLDVPPALKCLRLHHLRADGEESRGIRWFRPTLRTVNAAAQLIVRLCDSPRRSRAGQHVAVHAGSSGSTLSVIDTLIDIDEKANNEFFFNPDNIEEIEFTLDPKAFQLGRADYNTLLRYARRIAETEPASLGALKEAVENDTISPSFIKLD